MLALDKETSLIREKTLSQGGKFPFEMFSCISIFSANPNHFFTFSPYG